MAGAEGSAVLVALAKLCQLRAPLTSLRRNRAPAQRMTLNLNPIHDKPKKNHAGFTRSQKRAGAGTDSVQGCRFLNCPGAFQQVCLFHGKHAQRDGLLVHGSNTLFILMGAILVLAMHAGFAFLEVGTVRHKNQVNALSKILSDFAISALVYFFIGYWIAYGVTFFQPAAVLANDHGYALVKCFFLLTFAAAIPAIISGGIAERRGSFPGAPRR
jgi:hypothetical protein